MSDAQTPVSAPPAAEPAQKPTLAQRFAEAWINRSHRVCGRRLDPYCLHHVMLLDAVKNPLGDSDPSARISWGDLFQAVIICTAPYEADLNFPRITLLWHLRVVWLKLVHRMRRRGGEALAWHCAAFRNYQNDFESQPDLFFDEEVAPLTAPGLLAKAVFIQMHLHIEERRLFTMPIGKALFSYAAAVEQLTRARLLETEEQGIMDLFRKIQRGEIPIPADMAGGDDRPALTPDLFGEEAHDGS